MATIYGTIPFTTIALTGTTLAAVAGFNPAANTRVRFLEYKVSFDGANSANAPVVVQLMGNTFTANAPGTNSTAQNPRVKDRDIAETVQTVGATTWTTVPLATTLLDSTDVGQFNGVYHYICPFASPWVAANGKGFVIEATSPNNVNTCGKAEVEE